MDLIRMDLQTNKTNSQDFRKYQDEESQNVDSYKKTERQRSRRDEQPDGRTHPQSEEEPERRKRIDSGGLMSRIYSYFLMGPHEFPSNPMSHLPVQMRSHHTNVINDQKATCSASLVSSEESMCSSFSSSDDDSFNYSIPKKNKAADQEAYIYTFRSRTNVIVHFLLEFAMLVTHARFLIFAILFQFVHNISTNIAYYYHSKLSAAQRVPLADVGFAVLPKLTGEWWMVSEYIFLVMLFLPVSLAVSIFFIRWRPPIGKPLYAVQILRRVCMTLVACQTLRIISFLVTTLPGASRQCLYNVPDNLTSKQMLEGAADPSGNPRGWLPPTSLYEILFRIDATNGCGDLMFSSHTIFSMTFLCIIFKYFNWVRLKRFMFALQVIIVPFIVAARKHYSVDIFTALYVTPLVFETLDRRFPDLDASVELKKIYKISFQIASEGENSVFAVVEVFKKLFYLNLDDVPNDIIDSIANNCPKKCDYSGMDDFKGKSIRFDDRGLMKRITSTQEGKVSPKCAADIA